MQDFAYKERQQKDVVKTISRSVMSQDILHLASWELDSVSYHYFSAVFVFLLLLFGYYV